MKNSFKELEIKIFIQKVLKSFILGLIVIFTASCVVLIYNLSRIKTLDMLRHEVDETRSYFKDLQLSIKHPSIYLDIDDVSSLLTKVTEKSHSLVTLLKEKNVEDVNPGENIPLIEAAEHLGNMIRDYIGLLGVSGSDYRSLNVLYNDYSTYDTKQKVLEYVFNENILMSDIEDYIIYLEDRAGEDRSVRKSIIEEIIQIKRENSKLQDLLNDKNKNDIEKLMLTNLDRIENLQKEADEILNTEVYYLQASDLLTSLKNLHRYRIIILTNHEYFDALRVVDKKINEEFTIRYQAFEKVLGISVFLFIIMVILVVINFKNGHYLANILIILHKAFLNSSIQQILLKKDKKKVEIECVNNSFNFNSFGGLNEQREDIKKTQALKYYETLSKVMRLNSYTQGLDFGTLIHEHYEDLTLYEDSQNNRQKETKCFSVYRKEIGEYELISKVDVTKKILQIKDLKDRLALLKERLDTDELTGLLSLQALQDREIRDDNANKNNIFLYIRINNFNDLRLNYSTVIIDDIIKAFANSLKQSLDTDDNHTRISNAKIYHLQLDEFCIVYQSLGDAIDAATDIQKHFSKGILNKTMGIRSKFNFRVNDTLLLRDLELNIGISSNKNNIVNKSNETINRLAQAILASYEAAKNREIYCVYTPDLSIEKEYLEQQEVTNQIRYALDNDKIFVVCQGIHDSTTREVAYYEVLVRMKDINDKVISPGIFLPIAKKVGLYKDIQMVVIKKTFELATKYTDTKFSINLSNTDIMDIETRNYFLNMLEDACNKAIGFKGSSICIEILESEGIEADKYDEVAKFLENIKAFGCKVAIDDFGSGYSNFYRLLKVKFDYLKIDGSIIEGLVVDKNARTVLKTLVGFAHTQGYEVVAEFVKNKEILEIVREHNIEKVQGYELSKPEEPENIFKGVL